ncbi:hypothetical protein VP01_2813g3 [Puccinia sorghi]|uniref:Uncharacterized protein n=1 Tax=Puccinia sorghi TaxID=27349 RepID=A0A0L6V2E6_9BASI|nr:hypothetical protein VP01_2813g3 [Puccinia sorghi]
MTPGGLIKVFDPQPIIPTQYLILHPTPPFRGAAPQGCIFGIDPANPNTNGDFGSITHLDNVRYLNINMQVFNNATSKGLRIQDHSYFLAQPALMVPYRAELDKLCHIPQNRIEETCATSLHTFLPLVLLAEAQIVRIMVWPPLDLERGISSCDYLSPLLLYEIKSLSLSPLQLDPYSSSSLTPSSTLENLTQITWEDVYMKIRCNEINCCFFLFSIELDLMTTNWPCCIYPYHIDSFAQLIELVGTFQTLCEVICHLRLYWGLFGARPSLAYWARVQLVCLVRVSRQKQFCPKKTLKIQNSQALWYAPLDNFIGFALIGVIVSNIIFDGLMDGGDGRSLALFKNCSFEVGRGWAVLLKKENSFQVSWRLLVLDLTSTCHRLCDLIDIRGYSQFLLSTVHILNIYLSYIGELTYSHFRSTCCLPTFQPRRNLPVGVSDLSPRSTCCLFPNYLFLPIPCTIYTHYSCALLSEYHSDQRLFFIPYLVSPVHPHRHQPAPEPHLSESENPSFLNRLKRYSTH